MGRLDAGRFSSEFDVELTDEVLRIDASTGSLYWLRDRELDLDRGRRLVV